MSISFVRNRQISWFFVNIFTVKLLNVYFVKKVGHNERNNLSSTKRNKKTC